jgi:Metal binding domain of Ada
MNPTDPARRAWRLLGADRQPYDSDVPGALGGHRRSRIYGQLDCPGALRAISLGGYVTNRVFFLDEATAAAAGYRPCAVCLPDAYRSWKESSCSPTTRSSASASASGEPGGAE